MHQCFSPMFKKLFMLCLLCFSLQWLCAQQTTIFTEANLAYKRGIEFYQKGVFGLAQAEFAKVLKMNQPVNEPEFQLLRTEAELHLAKCAVRENHPDGEKLILDFARRYAPDPIASTAILEMGNYYYAAKKYDKAAELLSQVDTYSLSADQRAEVKFKTGYALFVKKKFPQAKAKFKEIKETNNPYYFHANYYYGMTAFFQNKYSDAISSFERAAKYKKYKPYVPFYVAQIYLAQGKFDKVISYSNDKLKSGNIKKTKEIRQLLGQAYFEKKDYPNAALHLGYYAERSSKMRKEDFFQLGFAQYKTENYKKAINNLEELSKIDSKMGQNAMYLLADCFIKTNQKPSARNAFRAASRMSYDKFIKEEALYNYGKLSYELSYDREAVTALQSINASSKYHSEAQSMLSALFLNTRDYAKAMSIIENLPNKSPKMRETYQRVAYLRGIKVYKDGDKNNAKKYFAKSLEYPIDMRTKALATYWLADIAHQEKNYENSIRLLGQFFSMARSLNRLPDESSVLTANYTQGYNFLKQQKYATALNYFQDAAAGIRQNQAFISNDYVKKNLLGDALLRTGDCYFKQNKYDQAIKFYNEAIQGRYQGFVYALYQKAIIEGLRGNTTDKILALENITEDFPNSEFADNALLQLGSTYQEIGKFAQAIAPLKTLVSRYKNSELYTQALLKLGLISYNQGNTNEAIKYYKDIFKSNPDPKVAQAALTALEEIYVDDLGKPDDYFAFLETIPGYKVNNSAKDDLSFKAAETQFENANYDRAIDGYSQYIKKFGNGKNILRAYFNRGESYSILKKYSEALKDYAFVVNKGQSQYYLKALRKAAIISYSHEKNYSRAYDFYSKLEAAATNDDVKFDAQLGALQSAYRMDDFEAVANMADKVRSNPRASKEQRAMANFYIGKIAFDNKNYDKALASFNQVTKNSDNEQTAEARYLIAYIYYVRRDLDIAKQLCLNANQESSSYQYWVAKSVILLADILSEQGDLFNARAVLEGLIENYKEDQELIKIAKAKLAQLQDKEESSSRLREDTDINTLDMEEEQDNN